MTRRSTRTTIVLSQASLTTTPCRTRFGMTLFLLLRGGRAGALAQDGLDARDIATDLAHARRVLELTAGALEAQVERLLAKVLDLLFQLVGGFRPEIVSLHADASSPSRVTKRVPIGSLAAARSKASRASDAGTPSSSNMMRPGLTRHTQNSGVPLPLPMRTSAGFCDTGTSGKTRIHTRPIRLMWRVMARRAASIWRAVTRPGDVAFSPKLPKLSAVPPLASPWMRPLCALRYLVRFGESMFLRPLQTAQARAGCCSAARLSCAIGSCASTSPLNTHTLTPQVP